MKKIRYSLPVLLVSFPLIAFASNKTLGNLIDTAVIYLNKALALLMGVAVVLFVYYIVKYFITPNDKRSEAGMYLLWSIVGFFVIFSMWGLVNVLINTFDFGQTSPNSWGNIKDLFPK